MKKEISPAMIGAIVIVVLAVAGYFFYKAADPAGSLEGQKPPGMPPDVQAEFNRRMGTAGGAMPTGPAGAGGGTGTAGAPAPPMRMTGPGQ